MADGDDLNTRLVLLEKTVVSREMLVDREEKLLERFEVLMNRYQKQGADDLKHTLKLFGHDMAEQIRESEKRIHEKRDAGARARDDKLEERLDSKIEAAKTPAPSVTPVKAWVLANWMWAAAIAVLVVILRPDLAGAAFKAIF
jgi:hypothetical protein